MSGEIKGRIHSIQSMGTVDGPGVRFVVFFQGCNLRCKCCHNPDTWGYGGGTETAASEILGKVVRYREYFGEEGGITLSGGEPILQPQFARAIFEGCHREGINTCLDTSGSILSDDIRELLKVTDRVLLDIKYTTDEGYRENVGCGIDTPMEFLKYLEDSGIPTTLRQVVIPGLSDGEESIRELKNIADRHSVVNKIELLPFRKICQTKYDNMKMVFPLAETPEPTNDCMDSLKEIIREYIN